MSAAPAVVVPQDGEKQVTVWSKSSEVCDDDLPVNELDKETSRLGDDITTKVRKPYTITKQRERWTGEEHQRFLEALKLYGRAWRQIEEHVGTKTAVQIRSHAQKFFSKLEREGSSGSSKGPVREIDIPPPRPKRKPAHPYPRKGLALNSHSTRMQSISSHIAGSKSAGCGVSPNADGAVVEANKSPARNTPEISIQHPLNCLSEKSFSMNCCQQPCKRGTEEVQCDAFPNESQVTMKLSRSTCAESEPSSSPKGVEAPQPDYSMPHNNNMPFGIYGSQIPLPYYYPLHSLGAFPNAVPLLNSVSKNPGELLKLEDVSNLASLVAAHAQLGNSLLPWLNQNPIAIAAAAAAAAAAATTPWPGLGTQPPPSLHLPLRPPSDRLDVENQSTVAAAMAAAAAASFADASAWLTFHGAFTNPPSEVRSLFKPNPVVHSASPEGQQQQSLANSSEGSKNGVTTSGQTSCEEHDASTVDGIQETSAHTNYPNHVRNDSSLPSSEHLHSNFCGCEEVALKNQENKGYSSTDNSCNMKKEKRRNGFIGTSRNGLLGEPQNGLQNSACVNLNGKNPGRYTDRNDQLAPRMNHSSNSPKGGISSNSNVGIGEICAHHGKRYDSLNGEDCPYAGRNTGSSDAFTSVHTIDCTLEEQCGSSAGKSKDCMASGNIKYSGNMEIHVEIDVPMQQENGWSHERHEAMPGKVSNTSQCMSSCGSTEDKKDKANNASLLSSKPETKKMQDCTADLQTDDSGSEIIPHEKGGKFVTQACLKRRWQGGKIMLTHTCTSPKSAVEAAHGNSACRQGAKAEDAHKDDSIVEDLSNGNTRGLSFGHSQKLNGSKASSSGSSKYGGHGFVPYRRD